MSAAAVRSVMANLKVPIICAPMAGGPNTVKLAAAVADAGGIGSFGFAYTTPAIVASTLAEAKKLSTGHLNANFFAMGPVAVPTREVQEKAIKALQALPHGVAGAGTYAVKDSAPAGFDLHEQLEGVWANPPTFLSFHFGVPPLDIVRKAQGMGICVLACATNVEEGLAIQEGGLDGVFAQGSEAGGHRGTFDADQADEELPTLTLVGLLKAKLTIPIIAAGGLMTGEDVWKATAAGAVGSSLGTAFLACEESGASAAHKRWLMDPVDRTTRLTRAFSGRRARGFVNAMVTALELPTATIAPFPFQNALTGGTRKASKDADDPEYQGLWAGTGFAKTRAMPASELMAVFAAEFKAAEGAHMVKQERMRNGYC